LDRKRNKKALRERDLHILRAIEKVRKNSFGSYRLLPKKVRARKKIY